MVEPSSSLEPRSIETHPIEAPRIEALLAESAWVRGVALALVRDAASADDLTQDAWLAALRQVREGRAATRGWWTTVLRNLSRTRRRAEARRDFREQAAAREEAQDDLTRTPERLEQQQLVLQAVRELAEPYRTTVTLRWLDELTPAEIAARTGLPVRTVHTRLTRATALLRERLERDGRVEARAWRALWLAPVRRWTGSAPRTLVMTTKSKLAFVAVVAGIVATLWLVSRPRPSYVRVDASARGEVAIAELAGPAASVGGAEERADESRRDLAGAARADVAEVAASAAPTLSGRLVDGSGRPVAGAAVYALTRADVDAAARPEGGRVLGAPLVDGEWLGAARVRSGADGRFAIAIERTGRVLFAVRARAHAPLDERALAVPASGRDLGDVVLREATALHGHVVDAQGRGVGGARLLARGADDTTSLYCPATWMDAGASGPGGEFSVDGLASGPWELAVESDDHPPARASGECVAGSCAGIVVTLADGFSIAGRVDGHGNGSEPLIVRAQYVRPKGAVGPIDMPASRKTRVDQHGTFALRGLAGADSTWSLCVLRERDASATAPRLSPIVKAACGETSAVLSIVAPTRLVIAPVDRETREVLADARFEVGFAGGYYGDVPSASSEAASASPTAPATRRIELPLPDDVTSLRVTVRAPLHEAVVFAPQGIRAGTTVDLGEIALPAVPTVRVRVVDALGGVAVRGARVRAVDRGVSIGFGPTLPRNGEPVALRERSDAAETDERGEATLRVAATRATTIYAAAEGFAPLEHELAADAAASTRELVLRLSSGAVLDVHVRSGAQTVSHALVRVRRTSDGSEAVDSLRVPIEDAATDAAGNVRFRHLASGTYAISVPMASLYWQPRGEMQVAVADGANELELVLPERTRLSGTIRAGGRTLAGAVVRGAVRQVAVQPGSWNHAADAGYARTDADGRFVLDDLRPGSCELQIEHPSVALPVRWPLELAAGDNASDCDVGACALRGIAVDAENAPIARLVIAIAAPSGKPGMLGQSSPTVLRATTDERGAFAFENLPRDVSLRLAPEGGAYLPLPDAIVLAGNEVREGCVLRFERAGELHVVLDAAADKEIGMRLVAVNGADTRSTLLMKVREATLRGLPPGTWSVSLRPVLDFKNETLVGPVDAVVAGGKTCELRLKVP